MKEKRNFVIVSVLTVVIIVAAAILYNALQKKVEPAAEETQAQSADQSSAGTSSSSSSNSKTSGTASGTALADFSVVDAAGNPVKLSSLRGKPTVVGVWATWCPYCVKEAPAIQQLYETYGDRVNFMMIDVVDGQRETIATGTEWYQQQGYTYPIYFDTDYSASNATQAYYLPTTIILKSDGSVYKKLSSGATVDGVSAILDKLLAS